MEKNTKMTVTEKNIIEDIVANYFGDDRESYKPQSKIVVQDREHLCELIQYISECATDEARILPLGEIDDIEIVDGRIVVDLPVVLNLNFLDVSKVTDMSHLFDDFLVAVNCAWNCSICVDISEWDVSNVTNMSHMLDTPRVDFGDLSKWNMDKVTDKTHMFYDPKDEFKINMDEILADINKHQTPEK